MVGGEIEGTVILTLRSREEPGFRNFGAGVVQLID